VGDIVAVKKFLHCMNYIILEFTPSIIVLYPSSPHSWHFQQVSFFSIYIPVYTVFAPDSPSQTLSPPSPLPLFAAKWMELENIMLSEVSQVQKTKSLMFPLICEK
jgi:hypothetical protein